MFTRCGTHISMLCFALLLHTHYDHIPQCVTFILSFLVFSLLFGRFCEIKDKTEEICKIWGRCFDFPFNTTKKKCLCFLRIRKCNEFILSFHLTPFDFICFFFFFLFFIFIALLFNSYHFCFISFRWLCQSLIHESIYKRLDFYWLFPIYIYLCPYVNL